MVFKRLKSAVRKVPTGTITRVYITLKDRIKINRLSIGEPDLGTVVGKN